MNNFWNVYASNGNFELLALLAQAALKTTLLLCFVSVFCLFFRRFTAAARHLLWTSILCASLLLPFLSFAEVLELPILPEQTSLETEIVSNNSIESDSYSEISGVVTSGELTNSLETSSAGQKKIEIQSPFEFSENVSLIPEKSKTEIKTPIMTQTFLTQASKAALAVWIAGMLLFLMRLLIGFAATNSLVRRASPFKETEINEVFSDLLSELKLKSRARLLASENSLMPMVCGIFRPVILLPNEAKSWSSERIRMVLLHELAHVARHDCLTQLPAQLACIFYWFNPLVWAVERRVRVEREQASDDYVLSIGTKPSEYAYHLLEIARSMQQRSIFEWSQTTNSVAMARRSQLEGRLRAILNRESKSRGALSRAKAAILVASLCVLFVSLTIVKPTAIGAQKPSALNTIFNNKKDTTDVSPLDSFLSLGEKRKNDSVIARSEIKETTRKQNVTDSSEDNEYLQADNPQTKNSGEQIADSSTETNLMQNVSETLREKIVANDVVSAPTNTPSSGSESNPFVNAAYRQEQRQTPVQTESADFIEEMASVGYTNLTIDDLVRLKQSDVSAEYVRNLRSLGFSNLTVKELSAMSIHGVTPTYIQAIRAAGYVDLSAKEITAFRIHDISPQFIKSLRDAGFGNLNAKQIKDFAVPQVTPNFISGIRSAGFSNLSPKELVNLRVYDITPEFIRQARSRLGGELNLKQIIILKTTGVLEDDKAKDKDND